MEFSRRGFWFFLLGIVVAIMPVYYVSLYFNSNSGRDIASQLNGLEQKQKKFLFELAELKKKLELNSLDVGGRSGSWLHVQQLAQDTVVQIFTQVSKYNWLEPYKTPDQLEFVGSGFFINEEGEIITNYHVVSQASSVQIQLPSFGRERFDVEIVGVTPDKDIALLRLEKESLEKIKSKLGKISYLKFGDSDLVLRTQEVLALGYPLGQERLKSTLGIVSGRERFGLIQITAPLNPGNSGGPTLNSRGEVIGVNASGILEAQNVGYLIPINKVKGAISDLRKVKLLRKPTLGCVFTVATADMVRYLNNPPEGGWYISKVFENGFLHKIGVKEGDMLYEVNGYKLDMYGDLSVPWGDDKISLIDFLNRFNVGDEITFVIYRNGEKKIFKFKLEPSHLPAVRKIFPEFEPLDYEIIGGMVVAPLTLNHVALLIDSVPDLFKYLKEEEQQKPTLVLTHVLPDSQAKKARVLRPGDIIKKVNDIEVSTLEDFRKAVVEGKSTGFLTVSTDEKFVVLDLQKVIADENMLSNRYFYKKSKLIDELA